MTIDIFQLLALTALPCLCVGFMIYDTITWFRVESKLDCLREDKRLMREELDSLRVRVKELEKDKKGEMTDGRYVHQ